MFSVEALLCCLYYGITEVLIFLWHLQFGVRKHLCCTCPCKGHSEFVSMIVVVLGSKNGGWLATCLVTTVVKYTSYYCVNTFVLILS